MKQRMSSSGGSMTKGEWLEKFGERFCLVYEQAFYPNVKGKQSWCLNKNR